MGFKFNSLIPELSVSNLEESKKFYTTILGFKVEYKRENFAMLSFKGSQIMIEQANTTWKVGELKKPFGRGVNLQIDCENVTILLEKIKSKGIDLFKELMENCYEVNEEKVCVKEFLIQDPDGYLIRFSEEV